MTTRFVIWFEGRCGSSLLASLLAAHDEILCRKENFCATIVPERERNPSSGEFDFATVTFGERVFRRQLATFGEVILSPTRDQVLEHLQAIYTRQTGAAGFKFKHPRQFGLFPEVAQTLVDDRKDLRVICLRRKNLIKRAISKQNLARLQKRLGKSNLDAPLQMEKLQVDIGALHLFCERVSQRQESFDTWARQFEHVLPVEYEDMVDNQQQTLDEIARFLNVSPVRDLSSELVKTTSDDLSMAVANYQELVESLRGTRYEQFL